MLSGPQDNKKGSLDGSQVMPKLKRSLAAALRGYGGVIRREGCQSTYRAT